MLSMPKRQRTAEIEAHPQTGQVYAALTNNELHGNFYGQIIRLTEKDGDPTSGEFSFEVFAAGGPLTGLASPDNSPSTPTTTSGS